MEAFELVYQMPVQAYRRYAYWRIYRHPVGIVETVVGILLVGWGMANYLSNRAWEPLAGIDLVLPGIALILLPIISVNMAVRRVRRTTYFTHPVKFLFTDITLLTESPGSSSTINWSRFQKRRETNELLALVIEGNKEILLPKFKLSPEQQEFIRQRVPREK